MRGLLTTLVLAIAAVGTPLSAAAQTTALRLDSDPGHPIGQGIHQTLSGPGTPFASSSAAPWQLILTAGAGASAWVLKFSPAKDQSLSPGTYDRARIWPFSPLGSVPAFAIAMAGRECTASAGTRFVIYEMETAGDGTLTRFAADFEHRCGSTGSLYGAVRFNSVRSSLVPFDGAYPDRSLHITPSAHGTVTAPGVDCGPETSDCSEPFPHGTVVSLQATPAAGYILLGWEGDCVGEVTSTVTVTVTQRQFCAAVFHRPPGSGAGAEPSPAFATAAYIQGPFGPRTTPQAQPRRVYISRPLGAQPRAGIGPAPVWRANSPSFLALAIEGLGGELISIDVAAAAGFTLLPGSYAAQPGAPLEPGPTARINMHAWNDLCSGGLFTIYEYEFDVARTEAARFAADFSLSCSGGTVLGSIRYRSSIATLIPFEDPIPVPNSLDITRTIGGQVVGEGIACGDSDADCVETFDTPTQVTLEAEPSEGFDFVGWTGHCSGMSTSTLINVNERKRCAAIFTPVPGNAASGDPLVGRSTLFYHGVGTLPARTLVITNPFIWDATPSDVRIVFGLAGVTVRSAGDRLTPGEYVDEYPSKRPLFEFHGGCFQSVGRVRVYEASFDSVGWLTALALDFETRCGSGPLAGQHIVGAVRFNSTRNRLVPFEGEFPVYRLTVVPSSHGLVSGAGINCGLSNNACTRTSAAPFESQLYAQPAAGYTFVGWDGGCAGGVRTTIHVPFIRHCEAIFRPAIPEYASTDPRVMRRALFFNSEPGEPVGRGQRRVWLAPEIKIHPFSRALTLVSIEHPDGTTLWMYLEAPAGSELAPGSYNGAVDAFGANSGPGLHIRTSDGGCSGLLTGRFVVHQITFASAASAEITALAVDFEQRCQPAGAMLQGSLRFNADRAILEPFAAATMAEVASRRPRRTDGPALIWRHILTGSTAVWTLNGVVAETMAHVTPQPYARVTDLAWELRTTGDMNRDGASDFVWQHNTTGKLAAWYVVGHGVTGTAPIQTPAEDPAEYDPDWKIVAAGDTDLDGDADLLWRNEATGALRLWHMNGTRQWDSVHLGQVTDSAWQVVALSDMNADGMLDIVWWHRTRGAVAAWYLRDSVVLETHTASHVLADVAWRLAGLADLNDDDRPDLLWQNEGTGEVGVWFMEGLQRIGGRHLEPGVVADRNWRIVAVR